MNPEDLALAELSEALRRGGYRFVTVTPESHRRVNARAGNREARSVRDVFGWSRPFRDGVLPARVFELALAAGALERPPAHEGSALYRSRVRFSSLGPSLYAHSAYPTEAADAVFFGPDTYRFGDLLARAVVRCERAVDVGCGSGAGGLSIAARAARVVLADVNPEALRLARVNAFAAGLTNIEFARSDVLAGVTGTVDLVVSNPPYLVDGGARTYRDGGEDLGTSLSVRIARESLARLSPGGRLVLYTGAPVRDGDDVLLQALRPVLAAAGAQYEYAELDPDVFGEELERDAYREVDRVAVVALIATTPR